MILSGVEFLGFLVAFLLQYFSVAMGRGNFGAG